MGRPLHNPPIARAAWPTLLARPGHLFLALIITILSALPAAAIQVEISEFLMPIGANTTPRNMLYNLNLKGFVSDWNSTDNFSVESSDQSVVTTEIIAEETFMRAVNL